MKLNHVILVLGFLPLAACVTETKEQVDNKPYVSTVATSKEAPAKAKSAAAAAKDEMVPGHLVVKCRIQNNKIGKVTTCGPTTVKLINEVSKHVIEQEFKGDKTVIAVANDGSYTVELSTKGCSENRRFSGLTGGMGFTAQFEDCGTK